MANCGSAMRAPAESDAFQRVQGRLALATGDAHSAALIHPPHTQRRGCQGFMQLRQLGQQIFLLDRKPLNACMPICTVKSPYPIYSYPFVVFTSMDVLNV